MSTVAGHQAAYGQARAQRVVFVVQADEDRVLRGVREIELLIADRAGGADHREGAGYPADISGRGVPEQNLDLGAAVPQLPSGDLAQDRLAERGEADDDHMR